MPTDACQYFYDCKGCGVVLRGIGAWIPQVLSNIRRFARGAFLDFF